MNTQSNASEDTHTPAIYPKRPFPKRRPLAPVAFAFVSLLLLAAGCSSTSDSDAGPDQDATAAVSTTSEPDPTAFPADAVLCRKIKKPEGAGAQPEPTPEMRANFEAIGLDFSESLAWMDLGDKPSYEQRVTVGLNTRDPEVMQSIIDLVGADSVCFDLPPPGFDDETPVPAIWTLQEPSTPDETSVTLLVDDPSGGCGHDPEGRVLPPVVEESETEVRITVELTPVPFGVATCEDWVPTPYTVDLTQPLGDRVVTGSPDS